jgi:uncharacterized protein
MFTMENQYSLKKTLSIWALSAIPMGLLAYVITPLVGPKLSLSPVITYWIAINIGLVWQFILSLIILKKEGFELKYSCIKTRIWWQKPQSPFSQKVSNKFLWYIVPFIIVSAIIQMGVVNLPDVDGLVKPLIKNLPQHDLSTLSHPDYKGAWWILIMYLITFIFNYLLGEELIYRGILLPKMQGVFGKWDWLANGILFGLYHLHKPQIILSTALYFGLVFALPTKLLKSIWAGIFVHGLEGILGLIAVLSIILGIS